VCAGVSGAPSKAAMTCGQRAPSIEITSASVIISAISINTATIMVSLRRQSRSVSVLNICSTYVPVVKRLFGFRVSATIQGEQE